MDSPSPEPGSQPGTEAGAGAAKDLVSRENELKERALRNKVMRTRKGSGGPGLGSG